MLFLLHKNTQFAFISNPRENHNPQCGLCFCTFIRLILIFLLRDDAAVTAVKEDLRDWIDFLALVMVILAARFSFWKKENRVKKNTLLEEPSPWKQNNVTFIGSRNLNSLFSHLMWVLKICIHETSWALWTLPHFLLLAHTLSHLTVNKTYLSYYQSVWTTFEGWLHHKGVTKGWPNSKAP